MFGDMALYTMVKNNTFNGMPLPSIVYRHEDGTAEVVRALDMRILWDGCKSGASRGIVFF